MISMMRVLDLQMLRSKKLLNDYNLKDHYLEVKEWYDGIILETLIYIVHGM